MSNDEFNVMNREQSVNHTKHTEQHEYFNILPHYHLKKNKNKNK